VSRQVVGNSGGLDIPSHLLRDVITHICKTTRKLFISSMAIFVVDCGFVGCDAVWSLVGDCQRFGGTYRLHLHVRSGQNFLRNVGTTYATHDKHDL
jgi:hypothetical protein